MKTKFIQVSVVFAQVLLASALIAQSRLRLIQASSATPASENCGVRSLYEVARVLNTDDLASLLSVHSPGRFVSIAELDELSRGLHLGLVPVERVSGDELPVPSVAHWGNDHFIAILERNDSNYRIFDPALGNARWLPAEQVNAGISWQFLAPAAKLAENWRRLSVAEAGAILGSTTIPIYYSYNAYDDGDEDCPKDEFKNDEKCPTGCDGDRCRPGNNQPDDAGCSACGTGADHSGFAMPVWKVSEPFINLFVIDKPMFYTTSMDNLIVFKLTYKQRNSQPVGRTNFFGVGVGWECNWRAYVEPDVTQTNIQRLFAIDGGLRTFATAGPNATETYSRTQSLLDTNRTVISGHEGGSWNYSQEFVTGDGYVVRFPSERVDVQGRTNRFVYATNQYVLQLVQYIDGEGRTNFLRYQNTNLPANVTEVENPYGRKATLKYDSQGFLTNIVDMIGFTNSFQYDSAGLLTNMTTPYGTTTFQAITNKAGSYDFGGDNAVNRALRVTEPNNGKQLFLYRQYANNLNGTNATALIPAFYPSEQVPVSDPFPNLFENSNLYERNSFYWGRQQYAALSEAFRTNAFTLDNLNNLSTNDYNLARLRHWLYRTNGTIGQTLSLERSPSPDGVTEGQKVWYDYPGKGSDTRVEGTNAWPSLVARVLPDGTTQFRYLEYNGWWNPTKRVTTYSTVGTNVYFRTNTLGYWGAGIDLGSVFDQDNNLLLGLGNYLDHLPRVFTNAALEVTTATIDATNRQVTSIKWPSGLTTTNIYFTSGATNFLQQTKDLETTNSISFTYDKGLVKDFTDARNLTVTLNWDALERLTNAVFPNGTVTLAYNKLDLSTFTDRLNNNYNFTYNQIRQMTQAVDPLTRTNTYSYCDCGNLDSITDPLGRTTSFFYDTAGRRTKVTYPGGYSITNFYSQIGRLTNVTDNAGNNATNWYSNQGLLTASSNAFGQVFSAIYDVKNRATNTVGSAGVAINQTYDLLNRISTRTWPDNGVEKFFYTARGLTNYTDQLTNITQFYYNEASWLTKQVFLTSGSTPVETNRFEYHQSGDLLRLYDGKNQLTSWNYDQYGRVTGKTNAAGVTDFVYQYDANDRLTNRTDALNHQTAYRFDAVGNLTNIDYAVSPDITLKYDALNRLTNMVDAVATTVFGYDANGLLGSEDGPWANDTVSYGYNAGRLRSSLTLQQPNASSWVQNYLYDNIRRLTNVVSPAGSFGYEYTGVGQSVSPASLIKKLNFPGGSYITNTFDSVARLLSTSLKNSSNTVLNSHAYVYDLDGELTKQTFKDGNYLDYTYDVLGQLKTSLGKESGGSTRLHEQFKYGYDYARNLNFRTNNALVQTFNANNLNQLTTVTRNSTNAQTVAGTTTTNASSVTVNGLTATAYNDAAFAREGFTLADGNNTFTAIATDALGRTDTNAVTINLPASVAFQYDANGNLTNDVRRKFTYDDENQLSSIIVTNAGAGSTMTTNIYDGLFRRRIRREFAWVNGTWAPAGEVRYVYDGRLIVQERDGNNLPLVSYTRGTDLSGSREGAGGIGGLLARTDHGLLTTGNRQAHALYHADGNGSITALVNDKQLIVAKYAYDPFGNILSKSGPLADANKYCFSSQEYHQPSGLSLYLYRAYDPNLQRFVNRDPIQESGGINLYAFVGNDPLGWIDFWGFLSTDKFFGPRRRVLRAMAETEGAGTEHESQSCQTQDEPY